MADELYKALLPSLPFCWAAATDVGKVRQENQDSYLIEPETGLFLVSDGMGGHRGGALAAEITAQDLPTMIETKLEKLRSHSARSVRRMLRKVIDEQSRQVLMEGASESGFKGMGATIVLALLLDERAYIANLGDSRAYRLRGNGLSQVTRDHSVVAELLEQGRIEPHEAIYHEAKGQITRYAGMEEKARPHVRSFALKKADRLMLCSDGLTDMVNEADIAAILRENDDCRRACETLIKAANSAGGADNITVIVVDWRGR